VAGAGRHPATAAATFTGSAVRYQRLTTRGYAGVTVITNLVASCGGGIHVPDLDLWRVLRCGIGIIVISALTLMGLEDMRQTVALKNLLTGCLRGVAVAVLVINNRVSWEYGLPMALGSLVGGYLGARVARRSHPTAIRRIVIVIGFGVAAYYFWKFYGAADLRFGGE
jgi:hypothetical protein